MGWILFGSFFLFLLVGVPVGLAVGRSALISCRFRHPLQMVPQTFFEGSSSYAPGSRSLFHPCRRHSGPGGYLGRILAIADATIGANPGGLGIVALARP